MLIACAPRAGSTSKADIDNNRSFFCCWNGILFGWENSKNVGVACLRQSTERSGRLPHKNDLVGQAGCLRLGETGTELSSYKLVSKFFFVSGPCRPRESSERQLIAATANHSQQEEEREREKYSRIHARILII